MSAPIYNGRPIEELIDLAHDRLMRAYHEHVAPTHKLAGNVVLFSGGGDSTALLDVMCRTRLVTHVAHIDTTIGIPETREHVERVVSDYQARYEDVQFVVESPDEGDRYEDWILGHGFPGPGQHFKAYQRLKERALRKVRRRLVENGREQRVIFIAGRRRDESARRSGIPQSERDGSIVWVSPIYDWTNEEVANYRRHFDLPSNPVSDHLHMSGECLCGAFAKEGELDEIAFFYPEVADRIRKLEVAVAESGAPAERCRWGWGAYRNKPNPEDIETSPLCSSCEYRHDSAGEGQ